VPLANLKAAVYLFGDPLQALCSMKRRNLMATNIKKLTLMPKANISALTDDAMLTAMFNQFKAWTAPQLKKLGYPVMRIRYEDAHTSACFNFVIHKLALKPVGARRGVTTRQLKHDVCVDTLRRTLSQKQLDMAKEMDEYKGDCAGLPRDPPKAASVVARTMRQGGAKPRRQKGRSRSH
jgi:hypothetical protein